MRKFLTAFGFAAVLALGFTQVAKAEVCQIDYDFDVETAYDNYNSCWGIAGFFGFGPTCSEELSDSLSRAAYNKVLCVDRYREMN